MIYRCGNEYTNTRPDDAQVRGCKVLESGNVTVVQGTRVHRPIASVAEPALGQSGAQRPSSGAQGMESRPAQPQQPDEGRGSDARRILQTELKKAMARQEELEREYNGGTPEKRGDESRNHQRYLDRVAEIQANLARNASDIAGIRRELERLGGDRSSSR
ncbi:hypothetical protein Cenrod_0902 [Candidatus Symbiobacter mobilis CR]|uniref:DUF4124 domain-containing protein n=2 Tax=Candidatus Symbiobacter TaxID=1436289 RepID=U5N6U4_9BURK|nr:hypothetical protein Cenrod_0902 [Candidatus Symbiobacter mobilis CR]